MMLSSYKKRMIKIYFKMKQFVFEITSVQAFIIIFSV